MVMRFIARVLIAAASLVALAAPASAASRVWISEYSSLAGGNVQIVALPAVAIQSTLDISGGAQTSAAFSGATRYIRVVCEVQCAVRADGTTATTSSTLLPALSPEYFGVQRGMTISVIAAP